VLPTVILLGLFAGLAPVRPWMLLLAILALGIGWGALVAVSNDADFAAGFGLGAANAAVGAVFGAGLRVIAQEAFGERPNRRGDAQ
jgi:hypothetical protein